jgi:hypothetical protein
MSNEERLAFDRWGLSSSQGRRVFVDAADRLGLDIEYDVYIMEQVALRP